MSKLESYYNHKATMAEGDVLPDIQSQAWENLEDKLIREEVMPELMQKIAPVLAKVKTPLSININYNPDGFISLNFTRNCLQMCSTGSTQQQMSDSSITSQETTQVETPNIVSEPVTENDITTNADIVSFAEQEVEGTATDNTPEDVQPDVIVKKKAKSIGFSVSFGDGTVFHEKKAVQTWLKTLQKIGLDNIINNQRKHEAWHTVDGKNICIVDRVQTVRSSDNNSPQEYIGGYYVVTPQKGSSFACIHVRGTK